MGQQLCTNTYRNATFVPGTNFSTGNPLTTCNAELPPGQTTGTIVPECGICIFTVRLLSYCQAVTPYLANGGNLWAWRASTDNHSFFDCPDVMATKWQTGLVGEAPAPSTINITVVNSKSGVVLLDHFLWENGPCSPIHGAVTPILNFDSPVPISQLCFPLPYSIFPSKGAGTAMIVFGVGFVLIGLLGTCFFKLKKDDEEYHEVPDGWRSAANNNSFGAHASPGGNSTTPRAELYQNNTSFGARV
jgi:hypothetical protein